MAASFCLLDPGLPCGQIYLCANSFEQSWMWGLPCCALKSPWGIYVNLFLAGRSCGSLALPCNQQAGAGSAALQAPAGSHSAFPPGPRRASSTVSCRELFAVTGVTTHWDWAPSGAGVFDQPSECRAFSGRCRVTGQFVLCSDAFLLNRFVSCLF